MTAVTELDLPSVKKGCTVAILYAKKHIDLSSDPTEGILHKAPTVLKVGFLILGRDHLR